MSLLTRKNPLNSLVRDAFSSPLAGILSVVAGVALVSIIWVALNWLILEAIWPWQGVEVCTARSGICWPFLIEKTRFILFGTYPFDLHYRPLLVSLLLCGLSVLTCRRMLGLRPKTSPRVLAVIWLVSICLSFLLMGGGWLGLHPVDTVRWNGLPVLLVLSIVAVVLAFPFGVFLALARVQSTRKLFSRLAAGYIETARGVPMLTVLFVGIFVLPLTLPDGVSISPVMATLVALIFFHAAYFAEDVRGGLLSYAGRTARSRQVTGHDLLAVNTADRPAPGNPAQFALSREQYDWCLQGYLPRGGGWHPRSDGYGSHVFRRSRMAGLCAGSLPARRALVFCLLRFLVPCGPQTAQRGGAMRCLGSRSPDNSKGQAVKKLS